MGKERSFQVWVPRICLHFQCMKSFHPRLGRWYYSLRSWSSWEVRYGQAPRCSVFSHHHAEKIVSEIKFWKLWQISEAILGACWVECLTASCVSHENSNRDLEWWSLWPWESKLCHSFHFIIWRMGDSSGAWVHCYLLMTYHSKA